MPNFPNTRAVEAEVDPRFPDRWSPRAYLPKSLSESQVAALLEAARWAPSAYNEQPWRLVYATGGEGLEQLRELLMDGNRVWADSAPMLVFFVASKRFSRNDKPNGTALFDCGAAWMSLALQARALGLYAHGMSGFHKAEAQDAFGLDPERWEVVAVAAVGYRGDAASLPEKLQAGEQPSERRPMNERSLRLEGRLSARQVAHKLGIE